MGISNLRSNLVYSKELSKPNDNYIKTDNNYGTAYNFLNEALIRKNENQKEVANIDFKTKSEYQKLASQFAVADLSKANQMINDFTRKQAEDYLQGNDSNTSSILQRSGSLLYSPEFTEMLKRGQYQTSQQKISDDLRANGKTDVTYNNDLISKSLYNLDGSKNEIKYEQIKTGEVLNYNEKMQDALSTITASQWQSALTPSENEMYLKSGTYKGLSESTLKRAANQLFDSYLGSSSGQNQIEFLTVHSDRNKNPYSRKDIAVDKMKEDFVNVALSKKYMEEKVNYEVDHQKLEELKYQNEIGKIGYKAAHKAKSEEIKQQQELGELRRYNQEHPTTKTNGAYLPFTTSGENIGTYYNEVPTSNVYDQDGRKIIINETLKGKLGKPGFVYETLSGKKIDGTDGLVSNYSKQEIITKKDNNGIDRYFSKNSEGETEVKKIPVVSITTNKGETYYKELNKKDQYKYLGQSNEKSFEINTKGSFDKIDPNIVNGTDFKKLQDYMFNMTYNLTPDIAKETEDLVESYKLFTKALNGEKIPYQKQKQVDKDINYIFDDINRKQGNSELLSEKQNKKLQDLQRKQEFSKYQSDVNEEKEITTDEEE